MLFVYFIEMAQVRHGNKYKYIKDSFVNSHTKMNIECPTHGSFYQTPRKHIKGQGCPSCHRLHRWEGKKPTTDIFINKALERHGIIYDYSMCVYISMREKVKIICKKHGIFEQKAGVHLAGCGCPFCKDLKGAESNIKNIEKVIIERFNKTHQEIYDYSLSIYRGMRKKVKIICRKHGIFEQTPTNHVSGAGCPACILSRGEKKIEGILTANKISYIRQYKFSDCVYKRSLPFDFYLPTLNACIEYDGRMHFMPCFSMESFIKTQRNDQIKTAFCNNRDIKLIRIPYTTHNIEKYLIDQISFIG